MTMRLILILLSMLLIWGEVGAEDRPTVQECIATEWEIGTREYTWEFEHFNRIYRVYIPSSYDGVTPVPLVMSLHGTVSSAEEQEQKTGWNDVADDENFIVVYPQGRRSIFTLWAWNAGSGLAGDVRTAENNLGEHAEIDDVAFFDALIDRLLDTYCINPAQVYITGFSNGGGMTDHLACELSDKITAIGTNAGAYTPIPDGCNPTRAMPVITFQGKLDRIVPYDGNPNMNIQGVEAWAEAWAGRNQCDDETVIIDELPETISAYRYTACDEDVEVHVYIVEDAGHTWAGGGWGDSLLLGKTNHDINTSQIMWDFFTQYRLE